jgi:hypothetical protein
MKRAAVWAVSLAALVSIGFAGASRAAPIAPLRHAVTENAGNVIQAYYYHHHYYHHRHWYHRHWRYW